MATIDVQPPAAIAPRTWDEIWALTREYFDALIAGATTGWPVAA